MNRKYILIVFILVALVQLYVPAKMIFNREDILNNGKEYKFIVEPVDPNDPFRGKYIILDFKENIIQVQSEEEWKGEEKVYVVLSKDTSGYAKINSLSKTKPASHVDFVEAKIGYVSSYDERNMVTIEYPFERFYMEESKAPDAERVYRESSADTTKISCALVNIKDGEAVLKDVLIDGVSIVEIVKAENLKNAK